MPAAVATTGAPTVRWERRGAVGLLWLDAPPVNVLSAALLDALSAELERVQQDPEVRVLVLASGQERAFAAGANIREMAPMGPAEAQVHGARGQGVTRRLERLPIPVIAAVHGSCVGGGCEIALACDLVVASEDAVFGQPEINLGVMPGWGGTQRLPGHLGAARSRWWIFSGRTFSAREAAEQGLVFRVVPRGELMVTAVGIAEELSRKPAVALAAAKIAVNRALRPRLDDDLALELDLWARLFGTADQKEGMQAFLEKRAPAFAARRAYEPIAAGPRGRERAHRRRDPASRSRVARGKHKN